MVDLEAVAGPGDHRQVLVVAGALGLAGEGGGELDLGPAPAPDDIPVELGVADGGVAAGGQRQGQADQAGGSTAASAAARVKRPSSSDLPRIVPAAPAPATASRSARVAIPPE